MKKIIFWIIVLILIIFTAGFLYFWYASMEMVFTPESIKSREFYCQRQKICDDCRRDLNCIIKECELAAPQTYIYERSFPNDTLEKWIKSQCSESGDIERGHPMAFVTGWCGDNLSDINLFCEKKTKVQVLFEWRTIKGAFTRMFSIGVQ